MQRNGTVDYGFGRINGQADDSDLDSKDLLTQTNINLGFQHVQNLSCRMVVILPAAAPNLGPQSLETDS